MNERIRELAEQAGFVMWSDCDWKPEGEVFDWSCNYDDELEKFAELIVRECANHCDLLLAHKMSSEWSRGTHDCSKAIKKHFGVDE